MNRPTTPLGIRCANRDAAGSHPLTPERLLHISHALHSTGLFDDEALIRLLDDYPHEDIHVTTMTVDAEPGQPTSDWRAGTTRGLSGEEILRAVNRGQLWLNIKRLGHNAPDYQALMERMYRELSAELGCAPPVWTSATLLVSSPGASVYYHVDSVPNVLWHIRGEKTAYVYPADDPVFAPREHLEQICSGESDEELPYRPEFDAAADRWPSPTGWRSAAGRRRPRR